MLPLIYRKKIKFTIGKNPNINKIIKNLNRIPIEYNANNIIVDLENKIVSTPAYMLANNIYETYQGIDKLVKKILSLIKNKKHKNLV